MLRILACLLLGTFAVVVGLSLVAGIYMAAGESPVTAVAFVGLIALAVGAAWAYDYLHWGNGP